MTAKFYVNTDGHQTNIENLYISSHRGGFLLHAVGFDNEFEYCVWARPEAVLYNEDAREYYSENPITENSTGEQFFWFLLALPDDMNMANFGPEYPSWPYLRVVRTIYDGEETLHSTDGLIGW